VRRAGRRALARRRGGRRGLARTGCAARRRRVAAADPASLRSGRPEEDIRIARAAARRRGEDKSEAHEDDPGGHKHPFSKRGDPTHGDASWKRSQAKKSALRRANHARERGHAEKDSTTEARTRAPTTSSVGEPDVLCATS